MEAHWEVRGHQGFKTHALECRARLEDAMTVDERHADRAKQEDARSAGVAAQHAAGAAATSKNQEEEDTVHPSKSRRHGEEPDVDTAIQVPQLTCSSGSGAAL